MRIAVVGAGVSGLVTAYLLAREHEVTIFEANERPGGHTNTIRVESEDGDRWIDTGFIVFNDRNYPNFTRLLERLGVTAQRSEMSFGVSDGSGDFEYSSASPNGLFAKRSHLVAPWFHRMVADLARFNRDARSLLEQDSTDGPSLADWLLERDYSRAFVDRLILPQAAAVWSADPGQMSSFPARFLVEFFDRHGMLGFRNRPKWHTIRGGSHEYVTALLGRCHARLHAHSPVATVRREPDRVELSTVDGHSHRFDELVLATHSDQALALLSDASDREHELLEAIPYTANEAVLHTDVAMLPRRRRAWASWNYHLLREPARVSTVTYHMNRLQALDCAREQYCVTLNRTAQIDPAKVIRTIPYSHPVFTAAGLSAQRCVGEISGPNRTHYAGAYWGYGFHEDGVRSALRVAGHFGLGEI